MQQQVQQPPIDLKNTTSIENFDGGVLFTQGVLLRTVSKFVMGTDEDALLPIPVSYDASSGKILESSIPRELREEYKDHIL